MSLWEQFLCLGCKRTGGSSLAAGSLWHSGPSFGGILFLPTHYGVYHPSSAEHCGRPAHRAGCYHLGTDQDFQAISAIAGAAARWLGEDLDNSLPSFAGQRPYLVDLAKVFPRLFHSSPSAFCLAQFWILPLQHSKRRRNTLLYCYQRSSLCDPARQIERREDCTYLFGWCQSNTLKAGFAPSRYPSPSGCRGSLVSIQVASPRASFGHDWDRVFGCWPLAFCCGRGFHFCLRACLSACGHGHGWSSICDGCTQSWLPARLHVLKTCWAEWFWRDRNIYIYISHLNRKSWWLNYNSPPFFIAKSTSSWVHSPGSEVMCGRSMGVLEWLGGLPCRAQRDFLGKMASWRTPKVMDGIIVVNNGQWWSMVTLW